MLPEKDKLGAVKQSSGAFDHVCLRKARFDVAEESGGGGFFSAITNYISSACKLSFHCALDLVH